MHISEPVRRFLINWAVIFALITGILLFTGISLFRGFEPKVILALFGAWWYASRNPGRVLFRADERIERLMDSLNLSSSQEMYSERKPSVYSTDVPTAAIAKSAVRRAGLNPDDLPVSLTDIGLLVYCGGNRPDSIARDESIRSDVTHVRPFIRVNFPLRQNGGDTIRFQLIDDKGKIRYNDQSWYDLTPGDNDLVTKTWLPLSNLKGETPEGGWKLRVVVGETPFAVHLFSWKPPRRHEIRNRLMNDGEIDERLQAAADRMANAPLSLDELLSDQEPSAKKTARRS